MHIYQFCFVLYTVYCILYTVYCILVYFKTVFGQTLQKKRFNIDNMHHPKLKKTSQIIKGRVKEYDVRLVRRAAKNVKSWWIYVKGHHVGRVQIEQLRDVSNPPYMKKFACITLLVEKKWQGRHIGRWAYKKAAWKSQLRTVFARMRRSEHANIAAAKAAGFVRVFPKARRYIILRWDA